MRKHCFYWQWLTFSYSILAFFIVLQRLLRIGYGVVGGAARLAQGVGWLIHNLVEDALLWLWYVGSCFPEHVLNLWQHLLRLVYSLPEAESCLCLVG